MHFTLDRLYLFEKKIEVTGINLCTEYIHNRDTCIDCCIGIDQQILNALSYNKNFKVRTQETFDIMDAFFRVIPMLKRNYPSSKDIFLPLEQMMRFKLYSSLKEPFKTQLLASWDDFYKIQFETAFQILKSYQHLLHCN
jgi:hypothetical protein